MNLSLIKKIKGGKSMNNKAYKVMGASLLAGTAAAVITNSVSGGTSKRKMKKTAQKAVNTISDIVDGMTNMMK